MELDQRVHPLATALLTTSCAAFFSHAVQFSKFELR
jgi:hypothetical protein